MQNNIHGKSFIVNPEPLHKIYNLGKFIIN